MHAEDKQPKKPKKKKLNVSLLLISQKIKELKKDEEFYKEPEVTTAIALRWLPIITSVREGNLPRQEAIDSINRFTNELWDFMEANTKSGKVLKYSVEDWVFPVKGYSPGAIGGRNGSGYIVSGFDFFDKNSGGHPAHDIFIADGNQDCIDDITNETVEILSMSGGIVIETRKDWTTDRMDIKGGNIVYVYDNYTNGLFYYAHLKEVTVSVGDFVKPGTSLGTLGRTGKNAYPSRSPTHLHIMYVRSFDGDLRPENIYSDLLKAKVIE
ncbi:MAG: M23 family metallopeptidase [Ignavibacteria bacterium]|nr:M23 family metallopeptidase [Ignavibacteria bacterium]